MSAFPYVTSFWAPEVSLRRPSLGAGAADVDVVVIGGGYAGLSSAYYLKRARPDLDVILLEKEYVGFGPSGRNFGAVVPGLRELRTVFLTDLDPEEERFAQAWYLQARTELERRIAEGRVDCEYRNEPLLMQSLDAEAWEAQQRESAILTARGTPHRLLDRDAFRKCMSLPYDVCGGLVRTEWRAAQPFKLARGFGAQLEGMGVRIFEGTAATELVDDGDRVTVRTNTGAAVRAKKAVLATNAYTERMDGLSGLIFPRHTLVLATAPLSDNQFNSLGFDAYKFVEDAGFTFYYTRVYENRLLMGGGPHTAGLFTPSTVDRAADEAEAEYVRIYAEMQARFPQLAGVKIDAAWAGPVDMTDNFMPIIRPLADKPNVIAQVGFCGDGLLNASITGKMVQGLVLGSDFEDAAAERIRRYMARA